MVTMKSTIKESKPRHTKRIKPPLLPTLRLDAATVGLLGPEQFCRFRKNSEIPRKVHLLPSPTRPSGAEAFSSPLVWPRSPGWSPLTPVQVPLRLGRKILIFQKKAPAAPAGTTTNNPNDNMRKYSMKRLWQDNESRVTIRKRVLGAGAQRKSVRKQNMAVIKLTHLRH